jgi:hypothetical protein
MLQMQALLICQDGDGSQVYQKTEDLKSSNGCIQKRMHQQRNRPRLRINVCTLIIN